PRETPPADPAWYEEIEKAFSAPHTEPAPRLRFFALLNYGSNTASSDARELPINGPLLGRRLSPKAAVELQSFSLRAGGGVRLDPFEWLAFLPTFTVSYNNVHGTPAGDRFDRLILQRDYSKLLVDWRSESITYVPQLEVRFAFDLTSFLQLGLTVYHSYLTTHVFSATSSLHRVSSRSWLTVLLLEFDFNTGWDGFYEQDLHIIPTFRYTNVQGDAVNGLGTHDLVSVELAVEFDTTETVPFSSRLGVHLRYVFGVHLRAWSVGASHEF
ncbi:MAG: hypothetical protein D6731_10755, partial [Planctomycetota bacterium]